MMSLGSTKSWPRRLAPSGDRARHSDSTKPTPLRSAVKFGQRSLHRQSATNGDERFLQPVGFRDRSGVRAQSPGAFLCKAVLVRQRKAPVFPPTHTGGTRADWGWIPAPSAAAAHELCQAEPASRVGLIQALGLIAETCKAH